MFFLIPNAVLISSPCVSSPTLPSKSIFVTFDDLCFWLLSHMCQATCPWVQGLFSKFANVANFLRWTCLAMLFFQLALSAHSSTPWHRPAENAGRLSGELHSFSLQHWR